MSLGQAPKLADAGQVKASSPMLSGTAKYPRFGKRGAPQAFPSKLYEILEGENPDIVGWTKTGRGFEVRDHARLSSEVLGRFFKQDKFSSFQRQLNLYGFKKITKGSEAGSYQHPHFRRGERTTLLTIRRSTKASPSRVPNSPASLDQAESMGVVSKPRPATPSPPPEPVARGVLPWPRQPTVLPSLPPDVRDVHGSSPNGANAGGGGLAMTANGLLGNAENHVGMHGGWDQRQRSGMEAAGAWAASGGGGGGFAKCSGGHRGSGGSWASADQVITTSNGSNRRWESDCKWDNGAQKNTNSDVCCGLQGEGAEKKSERTLEREHQKAEGLDREDVEVVGLLHRMAKEAQDSPSRTRDHVAKQPNQAPAPATRWEEQASLSSRPQPFRMPRPHAGPNTHHQGEQSTGTEHLYELLNRERESVTARGPFSYVPVEGRSGFPHPPHARLPAPYSTLPPDSSRIVSASRPGMDTIANDRFSRQSAGRGAVDGTIRDGAFSHCDQRHFEPEMNTRCSGDDNSYRCGPSSNQCSYPPFGIERHCRASHNGGVDRMVADMSVHHTGWHGCESPYASTSSKYHGDGPGNEGSSVGPTPKPEVPWSSGRSCEGGGRIVH